MARIRYLKPDFFKDEDIARLPYEARLFFQGLWGIADKAGRLEDRPARLKIEIMPYDDVDPEALLQRLAEKKPSGRPFILRYEAEGERYIQIVTWLKHQWPCKSEKETYIPAPPTGRKPLNNGSITVKKPLDNSSMPMENGLTDKRINGELRKGKKRRLKEEKKTQLNPPPPPITGERADQISPPHSPPLHGEEKKDRTQDFRQIINQVGSRPSRRSILKVAIKHGESLGEKDFEQQLKDTFGKEDSNHD